MTRLLGCLTLLGLLLTACGHGSSGVPVTAATPTPTPTPTSSAVVQVACSFSCPWNNGQKRVVYGAATVCIYTGNSDRNFYGGTNCSTIVNSSCLPLSNIPSSYGIPQDGATCPCTYDSSYDTTYHIGVGCNLSYSSP